ncbi:MAG: AI-2E family transporter [Betaproteobacteria bacterium]|nr:AI-2E family transporter [Betaproteobacteria bacterium]
MPNSRHPSPLGPRGYQIALSATALALLVGGCFLVLQPFLIATLWAMILVYTTWPIRNRVRAWARGSTSAAALLMTLAITLVLLAPLVVAVITMADDIVVFTELMQAKLKDGLPGAPAWLAGLPWMGERMAAYWNDLAQDSSHLLAEIKKTLPALRGFLVASGATLGHGVVQISLSILIAFFVYRDGEQAARRLDAAVAQLGGEKARHLLQVAASTVRSVVYGILGAALGQGVLAGIGFWLAGVPAATLLGVATFFLSPIPMGPVILWLPAAGWLFFQGQTGWAIFLVLWGALVVSSVDNFLKPILMSRGSDLPILFVFLGVLGGAAAFGFIGVFLGPTLLAVGQRLVQEWIAAGEKSLASTRDLQGPL